VLARSKRDGMGIKMSVSGHNVYVSGSLLCWTMVLLVFVLSNLIWNNSSLLPITWPTCWNFHTDLSQPQLNTIHYCTIHYTTNHTIFVLLQPVVTTDLNKGTQRKRETLLNGKITKANRNYVKFLHAIHLPIRECTMWHGKKQ